MVYILMLNLKRLRSPTECNEIMRALEVVDGAPAQGIFPKTWSINDVLSSLKSVGDWFKLT